MMPINWFWIYISTIETFKITKGPLTCNSKYMLYLTECKVPFICYLAAS